MPLQTGRDWDSPPAWLFLDSLTILFHLFCSPSRWHASKWNSSSFSTASFWPLLFPTYRRLQLPLYTRNRNMFCRPIEVQSLPSNLGTFWRHSANTWKEAKSGTRTSVLSFAVLKIRINDRKSKEGFLSAFTICGGIKEQRVDLNISARYLAEDLHFLPEGHKRLVLIMIGRLRTPERLQSILKRQTSTQQLQSPEADKFEISCTKKGLHVGLKR